MEGNGAHVIHGAPRSDYEITLIKQIIIPNYDTF